MTRFGVAVVVAVVFVIFSSAVGASLANSSKKSCYSNEMLVKW